MTRHDRRSQILAAVLAALAGYVDASGFIATGGYFVSFMSGNSTRLGIGIAQARDTSTIAGALIAAFLCGVVAGALIGDRAGDRRRPAILAILSLLLAASAAAVSLGRTIIAVALLAVAMGVENNVFERDGEVSLGVTYMTGSLVKMGQRIAAALLGKDYFGWISYMWLWLSFVLGVVGGAILYPHVGLRGMWGASCLAAALAVLEWQHGNGAVSASPAGASAGGHPKRPRRR